MPALMLQPSGSQWYEPAGAAAMAAVPVAVAVRLYLVTAGPPHEYGIELGAYAGGPAIVPAGGDYVIDDTPDPTTLLTMQMLGNNVTLFSP
jgi:hypothetical protein